ncbi:flagellar hook-associated protein FlgL [Oxalicibacterium solurbis]|uniref:Flagellar hook-associated protein 3 n=1 Tax=Oxalicibacterium solurbis TaxID=69280 RepID=A0A8J3B0Z6_9BURK|nr:flagellar hook-associated protein FlgL [Oxalicibacterium solurbis]GGI53048.1 flagellar hook-associated protein 3 [Oxalicibacterium solurbis]
MRISTNMMFEMGSSRISELRAEMMKTQQQISTNRRVLTPADDPIAAASAVGVNQAISMNDQFATNRTNAKNALSQEESVMQSVGDMLTSLKSVVVGAGNGSLSDDQRQTYLAELKTSLDEMLGFANTRDGNGNYIFAGYQTNTQPFTKTPTGATYNGDQGQRLLQIGASRQIASSDSGSAVFEGGMTGNGRFVTAAGAGNTGSGIVSTGSVTDLSQLTKHNYSIDFTVDPATNVTTYTVTDNTVVPPNAVLTDQPYTSGEPIEFDGVRFDIQGEPADGDSFSVQPSTTESVFTTITNLINALQQPATDADGQARLTNALNTANNNLDNTLENVSAVRSTIGSRLKEVDTLDSEGSSLDIQYQQNLSDLIEIDPVEAYSRFTQQQYTLTAAQQTFVQTAGLSLFDLLR